MIYRRAIALILTAFALAAEVGAQGSATLPKIGFLGMDSQMQAQIVQGLVDSLAKLGYVDGKNVTIEYRWAQGQFDKLPGLAAELAGMPVKVIVTAAPPAVRAAQQATATIPIVMMVHNPVGMGFAESLAHPGRNITGVAFQDAELSTKRLDLLQQMIPNLTQVAIIWNQAGGGIEAVNAVEAAAQQRRIRTLAIEIKEGGDSPAAVAKAKAWGAQGVVQLASPIITRHRKLLLEALAANRLAATCEMRMYVAEGCLMTYSANYVAMMSSLAAFVDRIMRGAKPGDLPIEQPREFDTVINLKTAQALGLTAPSSLLVQATEVIR